MRSTILASIALAVSTTVLAACGTGTTSTSTATPTAAQTVTPIPTLTPEPDPTPTEVPFTVEALGTEVRMIQGDDARWTIAAVSSTTLRCPEYGCSAFSSPDKGNRIVRVKFTATNKSTEPITVEEDEFIAEWPDGTRVEAGDGAALHYDAASDLGYEGRTIRPGARASWTLAYEVPKGEPFVVILTDGGYYAAEDIVGWKVK